MELELSDWGDGSVRLTFWDSMHGDDRVFVLLEDGTAAKAIQTEIAGEVEGEFDYIEHFEPCNLVWALRALLAEITERRKAERL
jgi:hypothetical protein